MFHFGALLHPKRANQSMRPTNEMFDVGCTIFDLARRHGGELSRFRQSYPAYDRPMLIFIALGLITYAAFLKLAPRLFRYSVSWRSVAIGWDTAWCCCSVSSSWVAGFSVGAAQTAAVQSLAGSGGIRLIALAFAMMIVVAFAIVIPAQVFLSNTFRRPRNQPMNSLTN